MPNILLSPTEGAKNNIVLQEFTIFIEQQYLITKMIKYWSSLGIVNSGRADPHPVGHDSGKQLEGQGGMEGSSEHWEYPSYEHITHMNSGKESSPFFFSCLLWFSAMKLLRLQCKGSLASRFYPLIRMLSFFVAQKVVFSKLQRDGAKKPLHSCW